jgi:hypothetical protein
MTENNAQLEAGLASDLNRELEAQQSCDEFLRPNYCPKCGYEWVSVESSYFASVVCCDTCDYEKQGKCDEDTLIERWNKLKRKPQEVLQKKYERNPW